jgi:glucan phosphoethanolaminetransferase (alkaline phosphatase superfamily)
MVIEHLRPIFYVTLLFSIIIMLTIIIKKKSVHNQIITFYISIFSIFAIMLSGITFFQLGVIADETGNAGDEISFYLFITVVIINVVNIALSIARKNIKKNK